jgi:tetratricopeptide (TPR) repeat protein
MSFERQRCAWGIIIFLGTAWVTSLCALSAPPSGQAAQALRIFQAGVGQLAVKQNAEAIASFNNAIATHALSSDNEARALFDRGVAYDSMGNVEAAIADYSRALVRSPLLAAALNNRANAYRRQGKLDLAKKDYMAALKIAEAPRQYSYYGLGLIAQQAGELKGAAEFFRKALAFDSTFASAKQSLDKLRKNDAGVLVKSGVLQGRGVASQPALRPAFGDATPTGTVVQLGAFRDERSATEVWEKAVTSAGGLLSGSQSVVSTVELPGRGKFWRLRTVLKTKTEAHALCAQLEQKRLPCMILPH